MTEATPAFIHTDVLAGACYPVPDFALSQPGVVDDAVKLACHRVKKILPEFVYDTAALEGSPYTFIEVQTLLDGVTVGGHTLADQKLVLNQSASWKLAFEFG